MMNKGNAVHLVEKCLFFQFDLLGLTYQREFVKCSGRSKSRSLIPTLLQENLMFTLNSNTVNLKFHFN